MAGIDWPAAVAGLSAGRLPCSGSEGALLRICASLTDGTAVDLGAALTGLDEANVVRVTAALVHAGGWAAELHHRPSGGSVSPIGTTERVRDRAAALELLTDERLTGMSRDELATLAADAAAA